MDRTRNMVTYLLQPNQQVTYFTNFIVCLYGMYRKQSFCVDLTVQWNIWVCVCFGWAVGCTFVKTASTAWIAYCYSLLQHIHDYKE